MPVYLGLDLAGSEKRATGFAVIFTSTLEDFGIVRSNEEIFSIIDLWRPDIVAIDSPLSYSELPYRECDLKLKLLGANPLPLNLPGMKMLIDRAIKLKNEMEKRGIEVIETFPHGILRVLGYEKKPKSKTKRGKLMSEILLLFGIKKGKYFSSLSTDEFDAILCSLAAYSYGIKHYIELKGEGCSIILPRPSLIRKL